MTHQDFMRTGAEGVSNRKKYWVRSFAGWESFSSMKPNPGHEALAALQKSGYVSHIITQNVDRLHHKAGSDGNKVLELHGTTHEVRCQDCSMVFAREEIQRLIVRMNGGRLREDGTVGLSNVGIAATLGVMEDAASSAPRQNPDGDVEIADANRMDFKTPVCPACRVGILKPDVVFFGDSLPKERTDMSLEIARNARGILVVGSSLQVMSAYRLVTRAKECGAEVVIVTIGETRADGIADGKIEKLAGEILPLAAAALLPMQL